MSIALSEIVVKPPALPIRLTQALCGVVIGLGAAILAEQWVFQEVPAPVRYGLAAACVIAAVAALRQVRRIDRTHRILITSGGAVRLFPYDRCAIAVDSASAWAEAPPAASIRRISCWPNLIIIGYRTGAGEAGTVFLTPRSVPRGSFRPLCVALRWITLQNDPAQGGSR